MKQTAQNAYKAFTKIKRDDNFTTWQCRNQGKCMAKPKSQRLVFCLSHTGCRKKRRYKNEEPKFA